jgi:hypothetical protein
VSVAWVAGRRVAIPQDELNEALRRALVVRAVGGDPNRDLELNEDAVVRLSEELDSHPRREELLTAIAALGEQGEERPGLRDAIVALLATPDVAWRAYACGLLADALED